MVTPTDCGCTIETDDSNPFQHPQYIMYCPLHAAAEETAKQRDRLLEALKNLVAITQQDILPNIRAIEGGQLQVDAAWSLIGEAHAAIATAQLEKQEAAPC